jgi:microcin C transport system substrate-binding protein
MEFELLMYESTMEPIVTAVQKNMERLGIAMKIRLVDTTQFVNRLQERDFDMISGGYDANFYPSSDLKIIWRSDYLDYTWNTAGVQDPAVDYLIDGIVANQNDDQALLYWGRALVRVARWDKFGRPPLDKRPKYSLGEGSWWYDPAKAARLPKR